MPDINNDEEEMYDDFDDNFDLDDDFGELDDMMDDAPIDERSPITSRIEAGAVNFKEQFDIKEDPTIINDMIDRTLPTEVKRISTGLEHILDTIKDTAEEKESIFKESVHQLATAAGHVGPKTGYIADIISKVKGMSASTDEYEYSKSESERDKEDIANRLDSLMGSLDNREEIAIERNRILESNIGSRIGLTTNKLLAEITSNSIELNSFNINLTASFYRRSLELQYEQLFATRRILKATLGSGQTQSKLLGDIVHNTNLPDIVKVRTVEAVKAAAIQRTAGDMASFLFRGKDGESSWSERGANKIKGAMESGVDKLADIAGMSSMVDETTAKSLQVHTLASDSLADRIKTIGSTKVREMASRTEAGRKIILEADRADMDFTEYLLSKKNGKDGIIDKILDGGANLFAEGGYEGDFRIGQESQDMTVGMSKLFHDSVTTAIPTILADIRQSVRAIETGERQEDMYYDTTTGKMKLRSGIGTSFENSIGKEIDKESFSARTFMKDTIGEDLTEEQYSVFMRAMSKRMFEGKTMTMHRFKDTGFYDDMDSKDAKAIQKAIKNNTRNKLGFADGQKERDLITSFKTVKNAIPDPTAMVRKAIANGTINDLVEAGIVNYDIATNEFIVDRENYLKMVSDHLSLDDLYTANRRNRSRFVNDGRGNDNIGNAGAKRAQHFDRLVKEEVIKEKATLSVKVMINEWNNLQLDMKSIITSIGGGGLTTNLRKAMEVYRRQAVEIHDRLAEQEVFEKQARKMNREFEKIMKLYRETIRTSEVNLDGDEAQVIEDKIKNDEQINSINGEIDGLKVDMVKDGITPETYANLKIKLEYAENKLKERESSLLEKTFDDLEMDEAFQNFLEDNKYESRNKGLVGTLKSIFGLRKEQDRIDSVARGIDRKGEFGEDDDTIESYGMSYFQRRGYTVDKIQETKDKLALEREMKLSKMSDAENPSDNMLNLTGDGIEGLTDEDVDTFLNMDYRNRKLHDDATKSITQAGRQKAKDKLSAIRDETSDTLGQLAIIYKQLELLGERIKTVKEDELPVIEHYEKVKTLLIDASIVYNTMFLDNEQLLASYKSLRKGLVKTGVWKDNIRTPNDIKLFYLKTFPLEDTALDLFLSLSLNNESIEEKREYKRERKKRKKARKYSDLTFTEDAPIEDTSVRRQPTLKELRNLGMISKLRGKGKRVEEVIEEEVTPTNVILNKASAPIIDDTEFVVELTPIEKLLNVATDSLTYLMKINRDTSKMSDIMIRDVLLGGYEVQEPEAVNIFGQSKAKVLAEEIRVREEAELERIKRGQLSEESIERRKRGVDDFGRILPNEEVELTKFSNAYDDEDILETEDVVRPLTKFERLIKAITDGTDTNKTMLSGINDNMVTFFNDMFSGGTEVGSKSIDPLGGNSDGSRSSLTDIEVNQLRMGMTTTNVRGDYNPISPIGFKQDNRIIDATYKDSELVRNDRTPFDLDTLYDRGDVNVVERNPANYNYNHINRAPYADTINSDSIKEVIAGVLSEDGPFKDFRNLLIPMSTKAEHDLEEEERLDKENLKGGWRWKLQQEKDELELNRLRNPIEVVVKPEDEEDGGMFGNSILGKVAGVFGTIIKNPLVQIATSALAMKYAVDKLSEKAVDMWEESSTTTKALLAGGALLAISPLLIKLTKVASSIYEVGKKSLRFIKRLGGNNGGLVDEDLDIDDEDDRKRRKRGGKRTGGRKGVKRYSRNPASKRTTASSAIEASKDSKFFGKYWSKAKGIGSKILAKVSGRKAALLAAKKIPGASIVAGVGEGIYNIVQGRFKNAGLSVASGFAGTFVGLGTVSSFALDSMQDEYDENGNIVDTRNDENSYGIEDKTPEKKLTDRQRAENTQTIYNSTRDTIRLIKESDKDSFDDTLKQLNRNRKNATSLLDNDTDRNMLNGVYDKLAMDLNIKFGKGISNSDEFSLMDSMKTVFEDENETTIRRNENFFEIVKTSYDEVEAILSKQKESNIDNSINRVVGLMTDVKRAYSLIEHPTLEVSNIMSNTIANFNTVINDLRSGIVNVKLKDVKNALRKSILRAEYANIVGKDNIKFSTRESIQNQILKSKDRAAISELHKSGPNNGEIADKKRAKNRQAIYNSTRDSVMLVKGSKIETIDATMKQLNEKRESSLKLVDNDNDRNILNGIYDKLSMDLNVKFGKGIATVDEFSLMDSIKSIFEDENETAIRHNDDFFEVIKDSQKRVEVILKNVNDGNLDDSIEGIQDCIKDIKFSYALIDNPTLKVSNILSNTIASFNVVISDLHSNVLNVKLRDVGNTIRKNVSRSKMTSESVLRATTTSFDSLISRISGKGESIKKEIQDSFTKLYGDGVDVSKEIKGKLGEMVDEFKNLELNFLTKSPLEQKYIMTKLLAKCKLGEMTGTLSLVEKTKCDMMAKFLVMQNGYSEVSDRIENLMDGDYDKAVKGLTDIGDSIDFDVKLMFKGMDVSVKDLYKKVSSVPYEATFKDAMSYFSDTASDIKEKVTSKVDNIGIVKDYNNRQIDKRQNAGIDVGVDVGVTPEEAMIREKKAIEDEKKAIERRQNAGIDVGIDPYQNSFSKHIQSEGVTDTPEFTSKLDVNRILNIKDATSDITVKRTQASSSATGIKDGGTSTLLNGISDGNPRGVTHEQKLEQIRLNLPWLYSQFGKPYSMKAKVNVDSMGYGYPIYDCSSLTASFYGRMGIWLNKWKSGTLKRSARMQFESDEFEHFMDIKDAKPGDIVWFKAPESGSRGKLSANHVGIYVGDGYLVHSKGHVGPTLTKIWIGNYKKWFVGFGRYKGQKALSSEADFLKNNTKPKNMADIDGTQPVKLTDRDMRKNSKFTPSEGGEVIKADELAKKSGLFEDMSGDAKSVIDTTVKAGGNVVSMITDLLSSVKVDQKMSDVGDFFTDENNIVKTTVENGLDNVKLSARDYIGLLYNKYKIEEKTRIMPDGKGNMIDANGIMILSHKDLGRDMDISEIGTVGDAWQWMKHRHKDMTETDIYKKFIYDENKTFGSDLLSGINMFAEMARDAGESASKADKLAKAKIRAMVEKVLNGIDGAIDKGKLSPREVFDNIAKPNIRKGYSHGLYLGDTDALDINKNMEDITSSVEAKKNVKSEELDIGNVDFNSVSEFDDKERLRENEVEREKILQERKVEAERERIRRLGVTESKQEINVEAPIVNVSTPNDPNSAMMLEQLVLLNENIAKMSKEGGKEIKYKAPEYDPRKDKAGRDFKMMNLDRNVSY